MIRSCEKLYIELEELLEIAQDISTGENLDSAIAMLERHEFHRNVYDSCCDRFEQLTRGSIEVDGFGCSKEIKEKLAQDLVSRTLDSISRTLDSIAQHFVYSDKFNLNFVYYYI